MILYTKEGSEAFEKCFGEKLDSVSMILSADFNFNFADDRNMTVINFFNEALGLTLPNHPKHSTFQNTKQRWKQFLHDIFINSF